MQAFPLQAFMRCQQHNAVTICPTPPAQTITQCALCCSDSHSHNYSQRTHTYQQTRPPTYARGHSNSSAAHLSLSLLLLTRTHLHLGPPMILFLLLLIVLLSCLSLLHMSSKLPSCLTAASAPLGSVLQLRVLLLLQFARVRHCHSLACVLDKVQMWSDAVNGQCMGGTSCSTANGGGWCC